MANLGLIDYNISWQKGRSVMAYIWPIYGLYMAYTRPIYGPYMAYIWPIHGL